MTMRFTEMIHRIEARGQSIAAVGLVTILLLSVVLPLSAEPAKRDVEVLLVIGAPGSADYEAKFAEQASSWKAACAKAQVPVSVVGKDEKDAETLKSMLKAASTQPAGQFWLVFIGHGTFDNREAKFNLRGPDVTAKELAVWCSDMKREMVVIHGGSASAPFLTALAGRGRVIVSATKSADEIYYCRFGEFFAKAIAGDEAADLNQDKQVSVLEAFRHASKLVAEFYEKEERISTEHALIDDDGDGVGARAELFSKASKEAKDGARASQISLVLSDEEKRLTDGQRARRDELERKLEGLKATRDKLSDGDYYREVEVLLRALAALYAAAAD